MGKKCSLPLRADFLNSYAVRMVRYQNQRTRYLIPFLVSWLLFLYSSMAPHLIIILFSSDPGSEEWSPVSVDLPAHSFAVRRAGGQAYTVGYKMLKLKNREGLRNLVSF